MAAAGSGERSVRAEAYVAGRMSPAEREAAEHLMEVDGDFRSAVLQAAERFGLLPHPDPAAPAAGWDGVRRRLASLPHMEAPLDAAPDRPQAAPAAPPSAQGRLDRLWALIRCRLPRA